ncbi:hypothetical protein RRG08_026628 [Elysia crispata]|uniref:Uncharacterized protein n=1 Tax=Elysia crispata TaxID=231223 RepID=A0AAE1AZY9_9GAST|nr:hypothetical protein RRG08_026628 [Elysia crispata]
MRSQRRGLLLEAISKFSTRCDHRDVVCYLGPSQSLARDAITETWFAIWDHLKHEMRSQRRGLLFETISKFSTRCDHRDVVCYLRPSQSLARDAITETWFAI